MNTRAIEYEISNRKEILGNARYYVLIIAFISISLLWFMLFNEVYPLIALFESLVGVYLIIISVNYQLYKKSLLQDGYHWLNPFAENNYGDVKRGLLIGAVNRLHNIDITTEDGFSKFEEKLNIDVQEKKLRNMFLAFIVGVSVSIFDSAIKLIYSLKFNELIISIQLALLGCVLIYMYLNLYSVSNRKYRLLTLGKKAWKKYKK